MRFVVSPVVNGTNRSPSAGLSLDSFASRWFLSSWQEAQRANLSNETILRTRTTATTTKLIRNIPFNSRRRKLMITFFQRISSDQKKTSSYEIRLTICQIFIYVFIYLRLYSDKQTRRILYEDETQRQRCSILAAGRQLLFKYSSRCVRRRNTRRRVPNGQISKPASQPASRENEVGNIGENCLQKE